METGEEKWSGYKTIVAGKARCLYRLSDAEPVPQINGGVKEAKHEGTILEQNHCGVSYI